MRCPNADTKLCAYPKCGCFKPTQELQATQVLGDYIQRVVEAENPVPEPITVDKKVIQKCVRALTWSNPYIAGLLQKELDKASAM